VKAAGVRDCTQCPSRSLWNGCSWTQSDLESLAGTRPGYNGTTVGFRIKEADSAGTSNANPEMAPLWI